MNFRTTLLLMAVFIGLGLIYLAARPKLNTPEVPVVAPVADTSHALRDVLPKKPGDLVKVIVQKKGQPECVFDEDPSPKKGPASANWQMTSPLKFKVMDATVEKFGRILGSLQYEVSYKPGGPGAPTLAEAGFDPPEGIIAMTDTAGQTITVETGNAAGEGQWFVRVPGDETLYVAKYDLRYILKPRPIDYGHTAIWTFPIPKVTQVEIIDRADPEKPVTYRFNKPIGEKEWRMESPVSTGASGKVNEMLRAMNNLGVVQWYDDRREQFPAFGLDPAALTLRITVTEEVEVKADKTDETAKSEGEDSADDAAAKESKKTVKTTIHEMHLSDRSPIGEVDAYYVRFGDDPRIGSLLKETAKKARPVLLEWRDLRITNADVNIATKIELTAGADSIHLIKEGTQWLLEGVEGAKAESSVVQELLKTVQNLRAVAWLDDEPVDSPSYGFASPQAEIRLTVPNLSQADHLIIGGYTEPQTKQLVFARRGETGLVAKVSAAAVLPLLRKSIAYLDRTITDIPAGQIKKIVLSAANKGDADATVLTFEEDGGSWSMTSPVKADVRDDRIQNLMNSLQTLRGESVAARKTEASAFGLDHPSMRVSLTLRPANGDTEPEKSFELLFTQHDGKYYAAQDSGNNIYEISEAFYKKLFDEYRTNEVWKFDDQNVRRFSIRSGDTTHTFERLGDRWVYHPEPDLPLDQTKVQNLLLQLGDLRTERYVDFGKAETARYGLSNPAHEIILTFADGSTQVLRISDQSYSADSEQGFYAMISNHDAVFLLSTDMINRFKVTLPALAPNK